MQCYCHIQVGGFGPDWNGELSPPSTKAPLAPTESILAAPALSLSGPQPFFSLYCDIPTITSSPVTSSCIFSLSFPTLQPRVPINRGHAVHIFKGYGISALDTQLNTNHFLANRQVMLGGCPCYRC